MKNMKVMKDKPSASRWMSVDLAACGRLARQGT
jgi:hypothetical protein